MTKEKSEKRLNTIIESRQKELDSHDLDDLINELFQILVDRIEESNYTNSKVDNMITFNDGRHIKMIIEVNDDQMSW